MQTDLTERERHIYALIKAGESTRTIGEKLNLTRNTVKFYRKSINRKLAEERHRAGVQANWRATFISNGH